MDLTELDITGVINDKCDYTLPNCTGHLHMIDRNVCESDSVEISVEEHIAKAIIMPGIKATIDTIMGENSVHGTLDVYSISDSKLEVIYSNTVAGLVEMTNLSNTLNNEEFMTYLTIDLYTKTYKLIIAVRNAKEIFSKNNILV